MRDHGFPFLWRLSPEAPARGRILACLGLGLALAACTPTPEVTRTVTTDDRGRQVTHVTSCEKNPLSMLPISSLKDDKTCRTEVITEQFCYRSLGKIECFAQPVVGRDSTRVR